jgi:hypothetical protein
VCTDDNREDERRSEKNRCGEKGEGERKKKWAMKECRSGIVEGMCKVILRE